MNHANKIDTAKVIIISYKNQDGLGIIGQKDSDSFAEIQSDYNHRLGGCQGMLEINL